MTWKKALAAAALIAAAIAAEGKDKKTMALPAVFDHARYVWVQAVDGEQFNPQLYREDRQAIGDVQDALKSWGRYQLAQRMEDADLIFVVRKGRVAEMGGGVRTRAGGNGPVNAPGNDPNDPLGSAQPNGSGGWSTGGEAGSADDMLEVFQRSPQGATGPALWMRMMDHGLDEPQLTLFQMLRRQVEHDYPPQAAGQQKP